MPRDSPPVVAAQSPRRFEGQRRRAGRGLRPSARLGRRRRADGVRRHEVPARGARAQPEARRRAALRHHSIARRISTCISRARSTASAARAACSTISSAAIRATAARPSFRISRIAGRSRQGRQDLHLLPAQGRAVPRRRRVHRRRREGDIRPHRQAAARASRSRAASCSAAVSEINARDKHTIEFKLSAAAAAQLHHVGLRQRLERHRPQEDARGQQLQPAHASSTFPAPAPSRASGASRTKSG